MKRLKPTIESAKQKSQKIKLTNRCHQNEIEIIVFLTRYLVNSLFVERFFCFIIYSLSLEDLIHHLFVIS
jgi:hypothetical protein